jgi:hypothetical protein
MASGSDPEGFDNSDERSTKPLGDAPGLKADSAVAEPRQSNTVRRKRRRRNFASSGTEYSRTQTDPVDVVPPPEFVPETRRRRSRRRSNRRNYRKALRIVMYVAVQVVFIALLVFLWMKISARVGD